MIIFCDIFGTLVQHWLVAPTSRYDLSDYRERNTIEIIYDELAPLSCSLVQN